MAPVVLAALGVSFLGASAVLAASWKVAVHLDELPSAVIASPLKLTGATEAM